MTKNILQIRIFGPFEISLDGQSLTNQNWCTQQTQTIGKILLTHRGRVVTSDQLIDIVWPNEPIDSARRRLHVRISQFRKGLKDKSSLVRTVHGGYIFDVDDTCWLDADEFQSLISTGAQYQEMSQHRQAIIAYEAARKLYRGDFLAEDLYSDWTFTQREFFRERYLTLLIQLSECYAQQGRYRLAITTALQALNLDPLRETIYVRLMLYHYYAGDRTQAISLYDTYLEILDKELGIPPLESTDYLVDQIRMGTLWKNSEAPRYPPPIYEGKLFEVPYALDEIPFVNRDREYAWLVSKWKETGTNVILLEGEAGIGKSRLLETFAGYISSQGAKVLRVRLSPGEQSPTAVVIAGLRGLLTNVALDQLSPTTLAALAQHFPELRKRVDHLQELPELPLQAEHQRFYQSISALAALNSDLSSLLIIDDAHRLNATAVDLLNQLSETMKILLSYRGEETPSDHPLRKTFGSFGLMLKPLPEGAVQSIIHQLSGENHPIISQKLSTQSQGNPLFVVTLLQHMFESGQLFVDSGGGWQMTDQETRSMPVTLQAMIDARLDKLDRYRRRILDYAAVLGGEFDFSLLQTITQQPEDILLTILDDLIDSALLIEPRSPNQAEFRISHDCYTEVTYDTILPIRRKRMHFQTAQAIEKLHAGQLKDYFSILADHYDRAEKAEPAMRYAILAGEQAAGRFASHEALYYFERALVYLPTDNIAQLAHLLLAREQIYDLCGMRAPQDGDLTTLEAISPELSLEQQAEIHLRRAGYAWIMGDNSRAKSAVDKAIQTAQTGKVKQIEARALLLAGKIASNSSGASRFLNRARKLAQELNLRALEGDIVRWQGNIIFWSNNYSKSQDYFEEALTINREVGDFRGELSGLNNLGHLFEILGQPQKAVQFYQQAGEICQKIGDRLAEGVILTNLGGLATQLGQYSQAQALLEKALTIRNEIGNDEGAAVVHTDLGDTHRHQGHYQHALDHYLTAIAINTHIEHDSQKGAALTALSVLYRELGAFKLAQNSLVEAYQLLTDADSPRYVRALVEESLLNHLLGDPDRALILAEQSLAKSNQLLSLHTAALKNMGHALTGLQRWDQAQQNFQQAISHYTQLGQPHLATEPLAGLAQIALVRGDLETALGFVEEILQNMHKNLLQGLDRLLWVYLTCYQVLHQKQDTRALDVLESAYTLLNKRAASIMDDGLRSSYYENIPENHQISKLWRIVTSSH
jgi:DNA-binding SARP family transcriptional activator